MDELNIEKQDGVWVLKMNRPTKHNALNTALTQQLLQTLQDADATSECRAIVLTGTGPSFCAGADTSEFRGFQDDRGGALRRADLTTSVHKSFSRLAKPVVAAVHGNALGGGAGLAIACDMVIAESSTRFGYPELKHGICPAIVMANLTRQLAPKKAFELVSTGRLLNGQDMVDWGLANQCATGRDQVLQLALDVAAQWAAYSVYAVSATKRLFHRCADLGLMEGLACGHDTNVMMRSFPRD
ncbi:enoyl-CoA hydratase/isomerase family protein [Castellaniella denitrificans]|uniref:enoyl-CoA hydratase/isomerase family protein n=1 Tax=Castellaniella denitrificans TaxID=56119 RepID=UPI003618E9C3